MGKEKTSLENALIEYGEIMEAAKKSALDKLSEDFPAQFQNILKEELNKNNKSSYNLVESTEESETKKNDMEDLKTKKEENIDERISDFTGDVDKDTPNLEKTSSKGIAFTDKATPDKNQTTKSDADPVEPHAEKKDNKGIAYDKKFSKKKDNLEEDFDITSLDIDDLDKKMGNAKEDDEVITMEEIEKELNEIENLKNLSSEEGHEDYEDGKNDELSAIKNKLQEMLSDIDKMSEMHQGKFNLDKMHKGNYDDKLIDEEDVDGNLGNGEEDVDEMHQGKFNLDKMHKGNYDDKLIDEEDTDLEITDTDIEEALGMAYSSGHQAAGDNLPGKDFGLERHKRYGSVNNPKVHENTEKKFSALLNENKKLIKRVVESKKYKEATEKLIENYKEVLGKYRTQLKEMTVFNTNLAHVNNILVNESLALAQEDKIKVIKEFKNIETITESNKKYESILAEYKDSTGEKTSITENLERKVSSSIQPSSKQNLVEVEAYKNNDHINKMKRLIEHLEKYDKK